jgi:hypothetical protein
MFNECDYDYWRMKSNPISENKEFYKGIIRNRD